VVGVGTQKEEPKMTSNSNNTGKLILWTLALAGGIYGLSLVSKLVSYMNGLVS